MAIRKPHGGSVRHHPEAPPAKAMSHAERGRKGGLAGRGKSKSKGTRLPGTRMLKACGRWEALIEGPFKEFDLFSREYAQIRMDEIVQAHGYCSVGVGAMIDSASMQLASSRYMYRMAQEQNDGQMLTMASKLSADARQNELAAWELAAREARVRPMDDELDEVEQEYLKLKAAEAIDSPIDASPGGPRPSDASPSEKTPASEAAEGLRPPLDANPDAAPAGDKESGG